MSEVIFDYIGFDHERPIVKYSDVTHLRMKRPELGDIVDFGENLGKYPFLVKIGRIGKIHHDTGLVEICNGGSVFWGEKFVSISGGPWVTVYLGELTGLYELRLCNFWNWGKRSPGAGNGVEYHIMRPIYLLEKRTERDLERVKELWEQAYGS